MEVREIFESAYAAWVRCGDLRRRRRRCKLFTYGDQWSDTVDDGSGHTVREYDYITSSGKKPYTNNLIRQLVKTVVGRYRTAAAAEGRYKGKLAEAARRNMLSELDARAMEEFLISGCAIQRVVNERRWGGTGIWVDNVDPRRFFVNGFSDPRGTDIELVGMLHDMTLPEVLNRFGGGSASRGAALRHLYSQPAGESGTSTGLESNTGSFFTCGDPHHCRVVEVWTLDSRPDGSGGCDSEFCWHCRWYAPDGTLLSEQDSPYGHRSHPFVVKFYPLVDGEVHSFVEDVLDQQKYINRLIVMQDYILACSAKGVLLYPLDQLPDDVELKDVSDVWARADGLISIKGRGGTLPQQLYGAGRNDGAAQMLQLQMQLFEQVSGVGSALMGRSTYARGADMLDSEVENATTALADLFETFKSFTYCRDRKMLTTAEKNSGCTS